MQNYCNVRSVCVGTCFGGIGGIGGFRCIHPSTLAYLFILNAIVGLYHVVVPYIDDRLIAYTPYIRVFVVLAVACYGLGYAFVSGFFDEHARNVKGARAMMEAAHVLELLAEMNGH